MPGPVPRGRLAHDLPLLPPTCPSSAASIVSPIPGPCALKATRTLIPSMTNLLSALTQADILERCHGRGRTSLRVPPRFLAHAEPAPARLKLQGRHTGPVSALANALLSWDPYEHDPNQGALLL